MGEVIKAIVVGQMQVNCYVVSDSEAKECVIIDPGDDYEKIRAFLDKSKLAPKLIINTHGHFDHIAADDYFNLPVYIHKLEADFLINPEMNLSVYFQASFASKSKVHPLEDKDKIKVGNLTFEVIHTPGHTPGSMCLRLGDILFSGDTLFANGVGRTDFAYGSEQDLFKSIKEKILVLNDEVVVYPGHGPATTVGKEKRKNIFLS